MNGARTPRSAMSSSTVASASRSSKSLPGAAEGLRSGRRPQYWAANDPVSVETQRLSIRASSRRPVRAAVMALRVRAAVGGAFARTAVGTAVMALRVGAPVGRAFTRTAVGTAVMALRVGAPVSRAFTAGAGGGDVLVVECHDRS